MSELDALVRRVDEDRWLASRFAPAQVRKRLVALYALNYELAHVSETVSQPAVGDIRLAWWRDALAAIRAGSAFPSHPVLLAYAEAHAAKPLSSDLLERMIEARRKDLDAQPFANWAEAEDYLDATAGGLVRLALEVSGAERAPGVEVLARAAGQAWGAAGLLRAEQHWSGRGRSAVPASGGAMQRYRDMADEALAQLAHIRVPQAAWPALGYVALTRQYLRRLGCAPPLLIAKQARLIASAATGRL